MALTELIGQVPGHEGMSDAALASELNAKTLATRCSAASRTLGAQLQKEGVLASLIEARDNPSGGDAKATALLFALEQDWEIDLDAADIVAALGTKSAALDALGDRTVSLAELNGFGSVSHHEIAKVRRDG